MNVEELLLKIGIDISPLQQGLRQSHAEVEKTSKKFEFLGMNMRELKKSARELGHEFPVLGKLALAAISPIEGAVIIAVLAVEFFKEKIDKLNESLDKQAEKAADPVAIETFEKKQDAAREATKEMERYNSALEKATSTEGDFQKAIDNSIAALERKAKAEQEVANIQASGEQKHLQDMLKAGLISEKQFAEQKGELEKKALQESFEREKKAREDKINLQTQGAGHAAGQAKELDEKARKALEASGAAGRKAAASAGRKEEADKLVKGFPSLYEHNKAVDEFDERQNSISKNIPIISVFTNNKSTAAAEHAHLTGESEGMNNAEKSLKLAKTRAEADKEAADKAKIDADELKSKSVEAAKASKEASYKLAESQKQQSEWLDQQTKNQQARESEIDAATRRAVASGLSSVSGVTSEDRRGYMPTLQEMASSGYWVNHSMSGHGSSQFIHSSPFSGDAQQMLRLQGHAQFDSLHGNFEQRDQDISNIKNLRAKMISEGAIEAGPQDVAEDFKKFLLKEGIKIIPVMTD